MTALTKYSQRKTASRKGAYASSYKPASVATRYRQARASTKRPKARSKTSTLKRVVSAVSKEIASTGGFQQRKNTIVVGDGDLCIDQGHDGDTICFLPVTWAIPRMRGVFDAADERWRNGKTVRLTGFRVRVPITYTSTVRVRMVAYRPTIAEQPFRHVIPPGAGGPFPKQAFALDWMDMAKARLLPDGPFEVHNLNRMEGNISANLSTGISFPVTQAPPPAPSWSLDSSDGTLFTADLAKSNRKPIADYKWESFANGNVGTTPGSMSHAQVFNIDWYCPLDEIVHFENESSSDLWKDWIQILFYWDAPTLRRPKTTTPVVQVGYIPQFTTKVFYMT